MGARILIVEDNELNRILLRDLLFLKGYELFEAYDGLKALEIARELVPDLVLMDIQLPELDGIAVTKILKKDLKTRNIPIIAVSSYAFEREKNLFLNAGGNEYITKPIDFDLLLSKIESILEAEHGSIKE